MIIFVPAYDDSTRGNLMVADALRAEDGDERLFAELASERLLERLHACPERPLFAMSHGGPDHLCGQFGVHVLDLQCINDPAVSARVMFVYACHTAAELGRSAAHNGAVWLGYTGTISAPSPSPATLPLFVSVFEFVRANFPHVRDAHLRRQFFGELKDRCDATAARLDELFHDGIFVEIDAHLCLLHLWQRLRIWVEGDLPEQHPDSPPPSLFS